MQDLIIGRMLGTRTAAKLDILTALKKTFKGTLYMLT